MVEADAKIPSSLILFGGSFNPPHVAHLAVAKTAADAIENSTVLWMPAATPPHKQDDRGLASSDHRLAMTRLAVEGNDRFEVSDLEIQRGDVSFTVDTLRVLNESNPDTQLYLLIGGDSLEQFETWREPEVILEMAHLLVYRRPGSIDRNVPEWIAGHVTFLEAPQLDVSSTDLRERMCAGRSVRSLVPNSVLEYLEEQKLYPSI